MPPSPWLSARMMKLRYFTATTRVSDQSISERTPSTFSAVGATPCSPKHSRIAYSGLVPMSPKTMPSAAMASRARRATAGARVHQDWTCGGRP